MMAEVMNEARVTMDESKDAEQAVIANEVESTATEQADVDIDVESKPEQTADKAGDTKTVIKVEWRQLNTNTLGKEELRDYAEELCQPYNLAVALKNNDAIVEIGETMDEAVGRYTSLVAHDYYERLANTPAPLKAACMEPEYTSIRVVEKTIKGSKLKNRSIGTKKYKLDVKRLYKMVPGGIGNDPQWIYRVEDFNLRMTIRVMEEIGDPRKPEEVISSWAMSKMAKKVSIGEESVSNTNMLKILNRFVADMIGDTWHATSHDVKYLDRVYGGESRKDFYGLRCASNVDLTWYLVKICAKIMSGEPWRVENAEIKKDK